MQIVIPAALFSAPVVDPIAASPSGNSGFIIGIILGCICVFGYFAFPYIFPKPPPPETFDEPNKAQKYTM